MVRAQEIVQRWEAVLDGEHVELALLRETESGLVFALDDSYVEQAVAPIVSPYGNGTLPLSGGIDDGAGLNPDILKDQYGGLWGEHPDYQRRVWQGRVATQDTQQGYWEWVSKQLIQQANTR